MDSSQRAGKGANIVRSQCDAYPKSLYLTTQWAHPSSLAGLLGISGASIVNPLLLDFGIHPQAAAATSTLMVLFTSSSAALSFGFSHQLNLQFALVFGLCCMAASLVGVILVQRVVERSGKVGDTGILPSSGPLNAAVAAGQAGPCTKARGRGHWPFVLTEGAHRKLRRLVLSKD